jgi:hypothetical protein
MDELENILNGEELPAAVEPQPEQQEAPEPEPQGDGQPRGPDGKFAPKGNDGAMPAPEDEAKQVPIGSYKAEKEKRQALEAQIEQLRREMEMVRHPVAPPEPPPSIWEDEHTALNHVRNDAVAVAVQQATFNARLDMSEMMARQANPDFDEMKAAFIEMMQQNPALQQQALNDPHPWHKAYQIAKNARTMQELGATNIDELKAQLLEQIKAEQAQATPAPILPRSLADSQSNRGGSTPAPAPLSLEDILGR